MIQYEIWQQLIISLSNYSIVYPFWFLSERERQPLVYNMGIFSDSDFSSAQDVESSDDDFNMSDHDSDDDEEGGPAGSDRSPQPGAGPGP